MIEWLSEIGIAILLVLLIISMYALHISTISLILTQTEVEMTKFITESGLVRVYFKIDDLLLMKKIYLTKYNETLGLKVLPALNITITNNGSGFTALYVMSWSTHVIPSLNYSLMKVVLNNSGIERVESERGTITFCTNTSLNYEEAIYVATITYYKLSTFKLIVPSAWIKHNYNASSNELYNTSNVLNIYAIIPLYEKIVPVNFTRFNDHVKLRVEYGTVAFIVVEESEPYVVNRFPLINYNINFRMDLCKYVICEYYTLMVAVGERT